MLPNPELKRWMANPFSRARSIAQVRQVRSAWASSPSIAGLDGALDAADGDPDRVTAIGASLLQMPDLAQSLFTDALRAIDRDPFFTPPFSGASAAMGESVRLFEHRDLTMSLVLVHADSIGAKATRENSEARSVTFTGTLTLRRVLRSGGGVIQRYSATPADDCLSLATHPAASKGDAEALSEDQLLIVDGRSESVAFVYAHSAILYLECEILAGCAPYCVKYDSRDLRPVAAATTDQCASRCQLMMSALTALGGTTDPSTYRRLMASKSFEVRWHSVRELMAVDPDRAWDCLAVLAANDRHPEIRSAARQMLTARSEESSACLA